MTKKTSISNPRRVLLVEGDDDRGFFEQLCVLLPTKPEIQVATPKDCQGWRNGKQGVKKRLPSLLELIEKEELKQLAIVVDADYVTFKEGYDKTLQEISDIVAVKGFTLAENQEHGLIFKHNDGFADLGLWIMPNNKDEGMLEDFIKQCVKTDELPLLLHASTSARQFSESKFKPHHLSKAEIATWLAWQTTPGHGLYVSVKDSLLDENSVLFEHLSNWLKQIYS